MSTDWQKIEKQIRAIDGNSPVLAKLYNLIKEADAIALVGAGASAELWPLWNQFLYNFIDYARQNGKINRAEADFFRKETPNTPLETAQQLRNKIGEQLYFEYLEETFKYKYSIQTGGAYTVVHKALMQLPIRNYVTLNYDAGLTNARAALYPKATTSYYFWDQEEAKRIVDKNFKRLVLHAHGRHDRADSIILTLDDYRRAYDYRPFVRLLEDLFAFKNLIIVGFGLNDPYIKQLFNNISKDYKKSPLRHIAFVGLDDKDIKVALLLRERVEMVYGARILFYPARNEHKALADWLAALSEKYSSIEKSRTAEEIEPIHVSAQLKEVLLDKFIHQPTDDENFKGRRQDFEALNHWANDPDTRTIAVTGIGGQGKTALIGRWLNHERKYNLARIPVFYWSFYEDLDVGKFLEQMVEFCLPIVRIQGSVEIEPISFILSTLQQARLLLVLDGLEVLQEEAGSTAHGHINHPLLEQLLQQWLRYQHQGLMILTSRFRFPQLERFSGAGFHHLNLERLSQEDGVSLLKKLGLRGNQSLIEQYVETLYGHPLALRVLASTVKRCSFGDLTQFKGDSVLTAVGSQDRLSQKLKHLLGFYERQLKKGQKELLGIISLFKRPVQIESFVTLLAKMKSLQNTPLAKADAKTIQKQLALLIDDFLVEEKKEGITTHPIIRDYFRTGLQLTGARCEVADFLKGRPGQDRPQNIEEVRDLVEAVQLLCDEGDFIAANDLYRSRLSIGGYGYNVFKNCPALAEGHECTIAFVGDKVRCQRVKKTLGRSYLAFYFDEESQIKFLLGNLRESLDWRNNCLDLGVMNRPTDMDTEMCDLIEISRCEATLGNIKKALKTISQAIKLSNNVTNPGDRCLGFSKKAYYEFLLGNISRAYYDFEISLYYQPQGPFEEQFLYSMRGNEQAEFLLRIKAWSHFKVVNNFNFKICLRNHWNDKLSVCNLLKGWYYVCVEQLFQAKDLLAKAEYILRPSGWLEQICRLDWIWGLLAEARGDYQKGLQKVNDSLFISADKGFRLRQADNLVLRARLHLLKFHTEGQKDKDLVEKAGDDGNESLKIAEQTGYIWAKVEALELLDSYHKTRATLSGFDPQKEKDLAKSYAKETESLKNKLMLTEEQMQALKIQAQHEFQA